MAMGWHDAVMADISGAGATTHKSHGLLRAHTG